MNPNRTIASRFSALLVGAIAAVSLAACGDNVKVVGSVEESTASGSQGLVAGATPPRTETTAYAGADVIAYAHDEEQPAERHEVASGKVAADGTFTLDLPRGQTRVVVEVRSSSSADSVIAAGLLDAANGEGERHMAPLNRESTLEAQVFAELTTKMALAEINTLDLRARIDAEVAAAYFAQTGAELSASLDALASAVIAAQEARVKAYAEAGITITQAQIFEASLRAAIALDASLSAGAPDDATWAAFYTVVNGELAAGPEVMNQAERSSSASFRLTIEAQVDAGAFRTAAIRSAALVEAHVAAVATKAILAAGDASQEALDAAAAASAALLVELHAATTDAEMANAYSNWSLAISGQGEASVLGMFFAGTTNASLSLELLIAAANSANATLELALSATISLIEALNIEGFTNAVVDAIGNHRANIRAKLDAIVAALGDRSEFAISIVLVANGAFTLG